MNQFFKIFLLLIVSLALSVITINANSQITKSENNPNFKYFEAKMPKDFVDKLNELGKLGYQLKFVERITEFSPPENPDLIEIAGIVELKEGDTFEYEWFKSLTLSDFIEQVSPKAQIGFYFCNRLSYSLWKNPEEGLPQITAKPGTPERDKQILARSTASISRQLSTEPIDGSIFILERKNKIIKPIKFKSVTAISGESIWGTSVIDWGKIDKTIETSINEIDSILYYPVSVFYSSKVFKTRVPHLPTILFQNDLGDYYTEPPIYKVAITFQFSSKFRKQIDEATKNGFNIKTIHKNFALLTQTNRKISYNWLEPRKKDFLQKLSEISKKGGRYTTTETLYNTFSLVFETPLNIDSQRFEYKVLNLKEYPSLKNSYASTEEFDELLAKGFQARSLFFQNGMNVLFERQINTQTK